MACIKWLQRDKQFLVIFLLSLISSINPCHFLAQGRQLPSSNLMGAAKMRRFLMGSSPPRCDHKCKNCGHCEAVQVPIAPIVVAPADSRGDHISNYKPMRWKLSIWSVSSGSGLAGYRTRAPGESIWLWIDVGAGRSQDPPRI